MCPVPGSALRGMARERTGGGGGPAGPVGKQDQVPASSGSTRAPGKSSLSREVPLTSTCCLHTPILSTARQFSRAGQQPPCSPRTSLPEPTGPQGTEPNGHAEPRGSSHADQWPLRRTVRREQHPALRRPQPGEPLFTSPPHSIPGGPGAGPRPQHLRPAWRRPTWGLSRAPRDASLLALLAPDLSAWAQHSRTLVKQARWLSRPLCHFPPPTCLVFVAVVTRTQQMAARAPCDLRSPACPVSGVTTSPPRCEGRGWPAGNGPGSGAGGQQRNPEGLGRKGTPVSVRNSPKEFFLFLPLPEMPYSNVFLRAHRPPLAGNGTPRGRHYEGLR